MAFTQTTPGALFPAQYRRMAMLFLALCANLSGWPAHAAPSPIPVLDFVGHPDVMSPRISPNGALVAVKLQNDDTTDIGIFEIASRAFVRRIRMPARSHVGTYWWASSDRLVFKLLEQSGVETPDLAPELYGVDADGGLEVLLFGTASRHRDAARAKVWPIATLPEDPRHVLVQYQTFDPGKIRESVLRMDVFTGAREKVAEAPMPGIAGFFSDRLHRVRYVTVRDSAARVHRYWRADENSAWIEERTDTSAGVVDSPLHLLDDGRVLYVERRENPVRTCHVRRHPASSQRESVHCADGPSAGDAIYSFDGRDLIGFSAVDGTAPRLDLFNSQHPDTASFKSLFTALGADSRVDIVSRTPDGSRVVLAVASDRSPSRYFLFDRQTAEARHLLSNRQAIKAQDMVHDAAVHIPLPDGGSTQAFLALPQGAKGPRPLVLEVSSGNPEWGWSQTSQLLANRGYAVLRVADFLVRPPPPSIASHDDVISNVSNLSAVVKWAVDQKIGVPDRICLLGKKGSAYIALTAAVRDPSPYRCFVGYAGVYDLAHVRESWRGNAYMTDLIESMRQEPEPGQAPMDLLSRLEAAVFVAHGTKGPGYPQAKRFVDALGKRKHPVEAWFADGEEGYFHRNASRREVYEKILDFLDRQIGAASVRVEPVADPAAGPAADS